MHKVPTADIAGAQDAHAPVTIVSKSIPEGMLWRNLSGKVSTVTSIETREGSERTRLSSSRTCHVVVMGTFKKDPV